MSADPISFLTTDPAQAWKELVKCFANGRAICNCQCAYYSPCGRGIDKDGNYRTDIPACAGGCSANQIDARNEIAKTILTRTPN